MDHSGRTVRPPHATRTSPAATPRAPATPTAPTAPVVERQEAEALLATRSELGPDMEPALVEAFTGRLESAIRAEVDRVAGGRAVGSRGADISPVSPAGSASPSARLVVAIASLVLAVPLSAIASNAAGLLGLALALAAVVFINVVFGRGGHQP